MNFSPVPRTVSFSPRFSIRNVSNEFFSPRFSFTDSAKVPASLALSRTMNSPEGNRTHLMIWKCTKQPWSRSSDWTHHACHLTLFPSPWPVQLPEVVQKWTKAALEWHRQLEFPSRNRSQTVVDVGIIRPTLSIDGLCQETISPDEEQVHTFPRWDKSTFTSSLSFLDVIVLSRSWKPCTKLVSLLSKSVWYLRIWLGVHVQTHSNMCRHAIVSCVRTLWSNQRIIGGWCE